MLPPSPGASRKPGCSAAEVLPRQRPPHRAARRSRSLAGRRRRAPRRADRRRTRGYSSPISPRQARFSIRQNAASSGVIGREPAARAPSSPTRRGPAAAGRRAPAGRRSAHAARRGSARGRACPQRPAHSATISSSCQVSATAAARSVSRKRAPSSTLQAIRVAVGRRSSCASSGSGPARRSERGLRASSSFSCARIEPPALPEPPGLDVEHRRVARLRQLVNARGEPVADAVAAEVDRRVRRQPGSRARPRRSSPAHAARSTRGRASASASSAGSSAARASLRSAPRLAS